MFDVSKHLDDFDDELHEDAKRELALTFEQIAARYPSDTDFEDREDAEHSAVRVLMDEESLDSLVAAWQAAREAERRSLAELTGGLILALQSESATSLGGRLGLDQLTVRRLTRP